MVSDFNRVLQKNKLQIHEAYWTEGTDTAVFWSIDPPCFNGKFTIVKFMKSAKLYYHLLRTVYTNVHLLV